MCFFLDPFFLPKEQVDLGAIKFVMSGANIMCPGLTSPGAKIEPVPQNTIVVSFKLYIFKIKSYIDVLPDLKFTIIIY